MDAFVLTVIGRDRTGLVDVLARVVADHGGTWQRSHVTELAGWFAGVVAVRVPRDTAAAFEAALPALADHGLDVAVRHGAAGDDPDRDGVRVAIVGADRSGIVAEISALLARLDVGIVDMRTWTEPAAVAGEPLFRVAARLALPATLGREALADALEGLAADLMVDLDPEDAPA